MFDFLNTVMFLLLKDNEIELFLAYVSITTYYGGSLWFLNGIFVSCKTTYVLLIDPRNHHKVLPPTFRSYKSIYNW